MSYFISHIRIFSLLTHIHTYVIVDGPVDVGDSLVGGRLGELDGVVESHALAQQHAHALHHTVGNLLAHVAALQTKHHLHSKGNINIPKQ